jgi:hypothetical protein
MWYVGLLYWMTAAEAVLGGGRVTSKKMDWRTFILRRPLSPSGPKQPWVLPQQALARRWDLLSLPPAGKVLALHRSFAMIPSHRLVRELCRCITGKLAASASRISK